MYTVYRHLYNNVDDLIYSGILYCDVGRYIMDFQEPSHYNITCCDYNNKLYNFKALNSPFSG